MSTHVVTSATMMLKPDEIAERMGVSKRTVLRWIERGDLAAYRVGSVTRIRTEDFDAFLRQHQSARPNQSTHL